MGCSSRLGYSGLYKLKMKKYISVSIIALFLTFVGSAKADPGSDIKANISWGMIPISNTESVSNTNTPVYFGSSAANTQATSSADTQSTSSDAVATSTSTTTSTVNTGGGVIDLYQNYINYLATSSIATIYKCYDEAESRGDPVFGGMDEYARCNAQYQTTQSEIAFFQNQIDEIQSTISQ